MGALSLNQVLITDFVKIMEKSCFAFCEKLYNVRKVGTNCFRGCGRLSEIVFSLIDY
ncbi:MAG: leucine-rich repeat domain-containing protein [Oscillospiraceae bacterium]|jgi:hypothetical protein|nr:leucine-rich repeat domain-containing protein [Oscillospiraceae bacterium]